MLALIVRFRAFLIATLSVTLAAGAAWAENAPAKAAGNPAVHLKSEYDAAARLQGEGHPAAAAAKYRAFVSAAVGELAYGYAQAGDAARADALFKEAMESSPDDAGLLIHAAQAAFLGDDYPRAQALATRALAVLAKDDQAAKAGHGAKPAETQVLAARSLAMAYQVQGRSLFKQNNDKAARAALEKAVDLDPNFDNGYALAVVCLDMDDGACAARLFHEMEASFGNTAALHMEIGLAYGNSDFAAKAIPEFKEAIALDNSLPEAHYALAAAYLASAQSNSMADAIAELKKQLAITPNDAMSLAALGHLYVAEHRYAGAAPYLKRAIALAPSSPDGYLYLGQMEYDTNHPAEAETALRKAIALTANPARNHYQIEKAHYLLGRLLARAGKHQEAAAEMKIVQAMMARTLAEAKNRLSGKADDQMGAPAMMASAAVTLTTPKSGQKTTKDAQRAQAVAAFEKELAPALATSYNNLGAMAASGGKYDAAFADFERAAEWNPQMPGLDLNLGHAAFLSSHFAEAVAPLKSYLKAHPEDGGIRVPLALSLYHTGDYAEVVETLDPVTPEAEKQPLIGFIYADSLARTGKQAEAVPLLEALEKAHPEIADVRRALERIQAVEGQAAGAKSGSKR